MIGLDNFITISTGYKKVRDLTKDDILYDPLTKKTSNILLISEPVKSIYYEITIPGFYTLLCNNDIFVKTDRGLIKPSDLCTMCRIYTALGLKRPSFIRPISETIDMVKIIAEDKDVMVVNGIYIIME